MAEERVDAEALNTRLADARERAQHARAKIEDLESRERAALEAIAAKLESYGYQVTAPEDVRQPWHKRAAWWAGKLVAALILIAAGGLAVAATVWAWRVVFG